MRVTRLVIAFGVLLYIFLWVLAANGATELVAPLLIPGVLAVMIALGVALNRCCLLYTSPSPRDGLLSRMPSSA